MVKKITNTLLPKGSWRRKVVKKVLVKLRLKSPVVAGFYNTWMQQQRNHPILREELQDVSAGPLISIVVPTYNTPQRYLEELVYSVISQAYENWELILSDASTSLERKEAIAQWVKHDSRIKVYHNKTKGISANTNYGIKKANGSYIAFCDHDDVIEPFALYEITLSILNQSAELIYTDEDKISDDGEIYFDPHYKPDWSPDLLTHVNYITHFTVIKKELLDRVGLLDSNRDGAQDYDLLLRVVDLAPKIVHVPKVLYHWRAAHNSTAQDFSAKKNITDAAKTSIEEHFKRSKINAIAIPKDQQPGFYELKFDSPKKISIIITPFASTAVLRLFTEILIKKTEHTNTFVEFFVPPGVHVNVRHKKIKIIEIVANNDYLKNALMRAESKEAVVISQVALPTKKDWALRLIAMLNQAHIQTVSPVLVHGGSVISDAGLVRDTTNSYISLFKDAALYNNQTAFGNTSWVRNVDALTGGVAAARVKELYLFIRQKDIKTRQLFEFSKSSLLNKKFNTIYPEVVLDTFAITLQQKNDSIRYFNNNLMIHGADYIPFTPESAVINILLREAENEGLKV